MNLCPRCGGTNQEKASYCSYCGVQLPKPPQPNIYTENRSNVTNTSNSQTVIHNYYSSPPQQSSVQPQFIPVYYPVENVPPQKKHTFWKILGWLFIFPLMVTLIAVKKKKWYWWLLALLSWIIYFGLGSSNTASAFSCQAYIINDCYGMRNRMGKYYLSTHAR